MTFGQGLAKSVFERLPKHLLQPIFRRMKQLLCATCLAAMPIAANAHPHVFIDTGVDAIFNADGQLTHIQVTWAYDEFFSLLQLEDLGLDKDGDGVLTKEEQAYLTGFDANWAEGYNGDLEARLDGQLLALTGPLKARASVIEGRIVTTHTRKVKGTPSIGSDILSIKAFDPTFYTEYMLNLPVRIKGNDACQMNLVEPDIDGQLARMQRFLLELDAETDLYETDIPLMGEAFATDIQITCSAGS